MKPNERLQSSGGIHSLPMHAAALPFLAASNFSFTAIANYEASKSNDQDSKTSNGSISPPLYHENPDVGSAHSIQKNGNIKTTTDAAVLSSLKFRNSFARKMAETGKEPNTSVAEEQGRIGIPCKTTKDGQFPGLSAIPLPEVADTELPNGINDGFLIRPAGKRIDPCADPEIVAILMATRDLDTAEGITTTIRRTSARLREGISAGLSVPIKAEKREAMPKKPARTKKIKVETIGTPIEVKKEIIEQDTIVLASLTTIASPSEASTLNHIILETSTDGVNPTEDVIIQDHISVNYLPAETPATPSKALVGPNRALNGNGKRRKAPAKAQDKASLRIKREKLDETFILQTIAPIGVDICIDAPPQLPFPEATPLALQPKPAQKKKPDLRSSAETTRKRLETLRRNQALKRQEQQKAQDAIDLKTKLDANKEVKTVRHRARSLPNLFCHQHQRIEVPKDPEEIYEFPAVQACRALSEEPVSLKGIRRLHFSRIRRSRSEPPKVNKAARVRKSEAVAMSSRQSQRNRAYSEGASTPPSSPPLFRTKKIILNTHKRPPPHSAVSGNKGRKKKIRVASVITPPKRGYVDDGDDSSDHGGPKGVRRVIRKIYLSETESELSDILDISDSDASIGGDEFPFGVEAKLARAEDRPRLKAIILRRNRRQVNQKSKKRPNQKLGAKKMKEAEVLKENPMGYDKRLHPTVVARINDKWMVPYACFRCLQVRQFCDRQAPCNNCTRGGHDCQRREGMAVASKGRASRLPNKQVISEDEDYSSSTSDEVEVIKKAPRKSLIKKEPVSPNSKVQVKPKEAKVKEPKKRMSNAITFRGDPSFVWIEKPHPQAHKPNCIGVPEVWCTNRQELCESLPYFRSYQSGTYHSGGVMHGYLLDGCAGPRDFANGRIVISHSGGKSATDEDGSRRLISSQLETNAGIRDLLNNMRGKWPLILIIGDQCTTSPSRIPHRYCVMDWFKVTAAWAEKDIHTNHVRWMFRFEKLNSDKLGWWASPEETYEPSISMEMLKACCHTCHEESPRVYEQGWMCLKPQCADFWKMNGEVPHEKLQYAASFINCHTPWDPALEFPPAPLRPPLATDRDNYYDGGDVARVYWKGMCCPHCGRLSCREFWAGWVCRGCNFKLFPPRTIFEADRLADPHRSVFTGPAIPSNIVQPGITWTRTVNDGMTCLTYYLKDCGTVTHILASEYHNKRPYSADWLFKEYQSTEMPFRRYPLKSHRVQGQLLTQQFSFNAGAPYKYIVAVDSTPFEESPRAVTRSLEIIQERVRLVHPQTEFNEILSVGYFEGQKMDFHDDGEEELGETVASISLGSPARMKFRVKSKYMSTYRLWEPETAPKEVKVEAGVVQEAIMADVPQPEHDDADEDRDPEEDERPAVSAIVIGKKEIHKEPRVKLELRLNHGDVVVMKGSEIQRIWEHAVHPIGLFRVAATARWINEPAKGPIVIADEAHPSSSPIENFGGTMALLEQSLPSPDVKVKSDPGVERQEIPEVSEVANEISAKEGEHDMSASQDINTHIHVDGQYDHNGKDATMLDVGVPEKRLELLEFRPYEVMEPRDSRADMDSHHSAPKAEFLDHAVRGEEIKAMGTEIVNSSVKHENSNTPINGIIAEPKQEEIQLPQNDEIEEALPSLEFC